MLKIRPLLVGCVLGAVAGAALAQGEPCGSLVNAYGPYDYRVERNDKLRIVDQNHFAVQVQTLTSGQTGALGADLDFILRASPNHHRVLEALVRLRDRPEVLARSQLPRSIECYFERALRFRPDDTTARMLYVTLLLKENRRKDAVAQLERTRGFAGENPFTHYNLGLLYLDAGLPDEALSEAHLAMALGFPRTELKARLVALGRWREPTAAEAAAQAASAAEPPASAASR